ncbi:hypothetical protein K1719_028981 [Acacia pycnantha]|nr:hypothetical protein K1719_028981 [Acacia pycnantha]
MLLPLRFTCLLLFTLSYLLPKANSETDYGCSVPNIDIQKCLNQSNKNSSYIEESCCKTLSQIAESGFKCLCSLGTMPPIALAGLPLSLSFLNCFISMPSLNPCPALARMAGLVTPESPKEQNQLSSPPNVDVLVSYPPPTNSTVEEGEHSVLPNGEQNSNTRMCLWLALFLFFPFWVFYLV